MDGVMAFTSSGKASTGWEDGVDEVSEGVDGMG